MTIRRAVKLRILELCQLNDITINKLSIICGMTQSTLNNIVNGNDRNVSISTIKKICDGLEITIQEFFNSKVFDNLEQEIE